MPIPVRHDDLEIRRELDASELTSLSEADADAADEEGYLEGNLHYQDLRAVNWDDVRYALEREAELISEFSEAADPAAAEQAFQEGRPSDGERESLWHLDVGIAAPVMALGALGAHTVLSCNGGAFGGSHVLDAPCVRFFSARRLLKSSSPSRVRPTSD